MEELIYVFVILLALLILISTFGGSLTMTPPRIVASPPAAGPIGAQREAFYNQAYHQGFQHAAAAVGAEGYVDADDDDDDDVEGFVDDDDDDDDDGVEGFKSGKKGRRKKKRATTKTAKKLATAKNLAKLCCNANVRKMCSTKKKREGFEEDDDDDVEEGFEEDDDDDVEEGFEEGDDDDDVEEGFEDDDDDDDVEGFGSRRRRRRGSRRGSRRRSSRRGSRRRSCIKGRGRRSNRAGCRKGYSWRSKPRRREHYDAEGDQQITTETFAQGGGGSASHMGVRPSDLIEQIKRNALARSAAERYDDEEVEEVYQDGDAIEDEGIEGFDGGAWAPHMGM